MSLKAQTLIDFCINNNNNFSDSTDSSDSEEEELSKEHNNVIIQQPDGSSKITIIVDTSDGNDHMIHEPGWENIEFAELDKIVFDSSCAEIKGKEKLL